MTLGEQLFQKTEVPLKRPIRLALSERRLALLGQPVAYMHDREGLVLCWCIL